MKASADSEFHSIFSNCYGEEEVVMLLLNTGKIANSIVSSPSGREQTINLSFYENNLKKNALSLQ
jgi:hypothetical protein